MIWRTTLLLSLVLLLSGLLRAAPPSPPEDWQIRKPDPTPIKDNPIPPDTSSTMSGYLLYQRSCLACHGAQGRGGGSASSTMSRRPADITDPRLRKLPDGYIFNRITNGAAPMPRFEHGFTETARWHIVNYVRTLQLSLKE